jgi:hypothetical protein
MGNATAIPKQELELSFEPSNWLNVVSYLHILETLDFNRLGIELQPVVNSFWEYNPQVWPYFTFFDPSKERFIGTYNFLGNKQIPEHPDWVVLPERAKLVVKENISIQQLFEAISSQALLYWIPEPREYLFYYLPVLFKEGVDQRKLNEQLNDILDDPALAKNSRIISTTVIDKQREQKIKVEFVVTKFVGWQFVRPLSVKYNGAKFEHYVKDPANGNVYLANSTNIGTIKRDYCTVCTKSEVFWACDQLMHEFMSHFPRRMLINEEMGLHLRLRWNKRFTGQRWVEGEFAVFEPDYTTFLE